MEEARQYSAVVFATKDSMHNYFCDQDFMHNKMLFLVSLPAHQMQSGVGILEHLPNRTTHAGLFALKHYRPFECGKSANVNGTLLAAPIFIELLLKVIQGSFSDCGSLQNCKKTVLMKGHKCKKYANLRRNQGNNISFRRTQKTPVVGACMLTSKQKRQGEGGIGMVPGLAVS